METVGVNDDAKVVGEIANPVAEVVREAEDRAAMVELRKGHTTVGGQHEELPATLLFERAHEWHEREVRDKVHTG